MGVGLLESLGVESLESVGGEGLQLLRRWCAGSHIKDDFMGRNFVNYNLTSRGNWELWIGIIPLINL